MVKLYQPYGTHRSVRAYGAVTIHWFVRERCEPVLPYEQLVQGLHQLRGEDLERARRVADELLSETEFSDLRRYLFEHHGEDLRTEIFAVPISLPRPDKGWRAGLKRPFDGDIEDGPVRFYRLSDEPGYSLDLPVWGAYILPATAVIR